MIVCLKQKSNERLEFLGDGVLEYCKYYLYRHSLKKMRVYDRKKGCFVKMNQSVNSI